MLLVFRDAPVFDTMVTLPPFRVRTRTNVKDVMKSLGKLAK